MSLRWVAGWAVLGGGTALAVLGLWPGLPFGGTGGPAVEAPPPAMGVRVRVEVLNGGGRVGVARSATSLLRDRGFDVVYYGNAASFDRDSSVVLDRVGRTAWAEAVAEALGIGNVRSEPKPNLYLDVSVVLGRDWIPPDTDRREADTG